MSSRRPAHQDVRVVAPTDIHDIRVLTATGPIDLPPAALPEPERQRA